MEHYFKVYVRRKDREEISAVNPERYSKRFINFINREVIINEKANIVLNNDRVKKFELEKMRRQFRELYSVYLREKKSMFVKS